VIDSRSAVRQRAAREQAAVLAQLSKGEITLDTLVDQADGNAIALIPVSRLLEALPGFEPERISVLMA
jgi:hypothetical protein